MRLLGWGVLLAGLATAGVLLAVNSGRPGAGEHSPARSGTRGPADRSATDARVKVLEGEVRRMQTDLERVDSELAALRDAVRASFAAPTTSPGGGEAGSASYLDRYILSFEKNGSGSEYFRLAVDAHARFFLDRIVALVGNEELPRALRIELVQILGTERFAGDPRVNDTLLSLLGPDTSAEIAEPVLVALAVTANASAVPALEEYATRAVWSNLPYRIYDTIAELAGAGRNRVLRRLLSRAQDNTSRVMILDRIERSDGDGALLVFGEAWRLKASTRAAAAQRLGNFRSDPFKRFVEEKLVVETDPTVRKALEEAQKKQGTIPGFDAMQAAGPPNANASVDDPKAWATKRGNMGVQWIELTYSKPMRVRTLRIYEVNSAGAVTEIQAVDAQGQRHVVWRGRDPTTRPGVFELRVAETPYRVRAVRLVLDTDRRSGWNEIDAVEVVGPDGRAWASSAVASSNYGD